MLVFNLSPFDLSPCTLADVFLCQQLPPFLSHVGVEFFVVRSAKTVDDENCVRVENLVEMYEIEGFFLVVGWSKVVFNGG